MAEELLNVPKLTIRHYKNKSLYDSYSGSRNDGDISIIGDSMSVYGISVIDDLVSKVNANIEINANKLKEIAESGISQFNGKIDDIKANTYTKVEADGKFQPKGKYVKEEYLQQLETAWSDELDRKADKDDVYAKDEVYTKEEVDEKVSRLSKNVYTKVETDGKFQPKGKYVKEEYLHQLESAWSDELDKKADKDEVYTKGESDRQYQAKGAYLTQNDVFDTSTIKLPNGAKIGVE